MSESETIAVIVIAAILAVIFGSWALAWRARRHKDARLQADALPQALAEPRSQHSVLVLATTRADAPLERVAVDGLALRSQSRLAIHDAGLVIELPGKHAPVFISRERLRGVGHANWALDRGSGGDRIVVVRWLAGSGDEALEVDTSLRGQSPHDLVAAIESLLPTPTPSGDSL